MKIVKIYFFEKISFSFYNELLTFFMYFSIEIILYVKIKKLLRFFISIKTKFYMCR